VRSFFVTRPEIPDPLSEVMSTPCSAAIRLTSGEDFVRRRSSREPGGGDPGTIAGNPGEVVRPSACGAGAGVAIAERAAGASAGLPVFPSSRLADDSGTGAAGAGAVTAAFTSVSSRATTAFTGTVSPSWTRISARIPALTAWTSESTLSVEISKMVSSRFTASPTFFIHFVNVPSASDSPIEGIRTSIRAIDSLLSDS
jgi:hypothetical protein